MFHKQGCPLKALAFFEQHVLNCQQIRVKHFPHHRRPTPKYSFEKIYFKKVTLIFVKINTFGKDNFWLQFTCKK
jgi:hypothetical protein